MKPLSFKNWLKEKFAIDFDNTEVTDQTEKIWHEGYEEYLKEWEITK